MVNFSSYITDINNNLLQIINNVTSLPKVLYKQDMVIISYENLNEIYKDLMIKTFLFVIFGVFLPFYTVVLTYNFTTAYLAKRKIMKIKMETINYCDDDDSDDEDYAPDMDNCTDDSSDISDAKPDFSDTEEDEIEGEEGSSSSSNVSINMSQVDQMIMDDQMNIKQSHSIQEDMGISSELYQAARRSSRYRK